MKRALCLMACLAVAPEAAAQVEEAEEGEVLADASALTEPRDADDDAPVESSGARAIEEPPPATEPAPVETTVVVEASPAASPAVTEVEPATQTVDDETPPSTDTADSSGDGHDWTDDLEISGFADAYAQGTWTLPEPFSGDQSALIGYRPYTYINGLTVSFVGFDMEYDGGDVGATLNLRFGTSVPRLLGPTSGLPDGMQFLKQAYATWRPFEGASIDFGQFDTIYGAEVSESWNNHTYSRGALYNLVQPFYHTGFRVAYAPPGTGVTVTGLAVNGWNNVLDNNDGKTFGLQIGYENGPVSISGGYLAGPEGDSNDDLWRHFGDLLVTVSIDDLEITANADYIAEDLGGGTFDQLWGVMLSGRLRFPPYVALGLRGEYIGDPDTDTGLVTATATIEVTPMEHLILRLDTRVDVSTEPDFQDPSGAPSETVVSSILGVVVRTN
ncbi:MAG: outer membrane beta-barrel protein [Sandaracinaceae bacterium]|nr:outer membrane beta-barrel protein [Sandaracinaceae bacterium]